MDFGRLCKVISRGLEFLKLNLIHLQSSFSQATNKLSLLSRSCLKMSITAMISESILDILNQ